MTHLSRRQFAALAASAAAAPFAFGEPSIAAAPTVEALIDRIKKQIGVEWKLESTDGIKAGNPSTLATGIATTSMATLTVLRQAVKAGVNLVITAQPTFYARAETGPLRPDPIINAKTEFIASNNLVVFRLSDHWRLRRPDPLSQGLAAALDWTRYQSAGDPSQFDIPAVSLESLAGTIKRRLQSRGGIRIVGNPQIAVRRVGLLPGTTPIQASLKMLPTVDAIIAGEVREWESVEYVRDKAFAGERKALILVGRVASEEPGMNSCAEWLKTFVPEVPVRHIAAGDPYWRPE
jgi:putative NIF3 family GTP cyclohydrolase 1 type 2